MFGFNDFKRTRVTNSESRLFGECTSAMKHFLKLLNQMQANNLFYNSYSLFHPSYFDKLRQSLYTIAFLLLPTFSKRFYTAITPHRQGWRNRVAREEGKCPTPPNFIIHYIIEFTLQNDFTKIFYNVGALYMAAFFRFSRKTKNLNFFVFSRKIGEQKNEKSISPKKSSFLGLFPLRSPF